MNSINLITTAKTQLSRGANVIKLLCPQFTNFCNKQVFVPGKPFKPCLIFASKAGDYTSEADLKCSTLE
jgi:hypothetical protein